MPRARTTPELRRIKIEDLAYGGEGVARMDGKVVFIPYGLPGEEVEIEIVEEKRDFARGKILAILKPSLERIAPKCAHFGVCGGCQLQHLPDPAQVQWKMTWARKMLDRLQKEEIEWLAPISASPTWGYRQRLQLHGNEQGQWGFYQTKSHEVVPISECPIALPQIMTALPKALGSLPKHAKKVELMANAQTGEVLVHAGTDEDEVGLERKILGYRMWTTGNSFTQVHDEQNQNLVKAVLEFSGALAGELKNKTVWDLYSGNGNFSIPLSVHAKEVYGVEENPQSYRDALKNCQVNQIRNVMAIQGSVEQKWGSLLKKFSTPDLIVLDPPRNGAKEVMSKILKLEKPRVIYVSCDLATLARDLKILIQGGYRMKKAQVLDLFPQTYHLEVVVALQ